MLEVGVKAPDFELPDQNGKIHRLSDYAGKKVVLYFYPKDNTARYSPFMMLFRTVIFFPCQKASFVSKVQSSKRAFSMY